MTIGNTHECFVAAQQYVIGQKNGKCMLNALHSLGVQTIFHHGFCMVGCIVGSWLFTANCLDQLRHKSRLSSPNSRVQQEGGGVIEVTGK